MKKLLAICVVGFCMASAQAASDVKIERVPLGSGVQNLHGVENARPVGDLGVQHVPQYMPGYPTAATIWPHVVEVPCVKGVCKGYYTNPGSERGEYKFFVPIEIAAPAVTERIIERQVVMPPVYIEKKINQ